MNNWDSSSNSDFISSFTNDISENLNINNKVIGELKLIYKSRSGWSQLYRCSIHGKLHIIKSLQKQYHGAAFYETALNKEFNIGFQLEHPNICRTISWLPTQKFGNSILMEYIDGITLEEFISQKRLTENLAYKIINELCDALQYLHSKQIVHRDIKPSNILITHNGYNVKLIDFSLSDCDSYEILKNPAGTRHYLAPEATDPKASLDIRTDIYSLGIVIQEMALSLSNKQAIKHLLSISQLCTKANRDKRPYSVSEIKRMLNNKRIKWNLKNVLTIPTSAAAAIAIAFVIYNYTNFLSVKQQEPFKDIIKTDNITFGNYAYSKECMDLLHTINGQTDTTKIFKELQDILNKDFPLTVQQQSKSYKRLLENLKQEARRIYSGKVYSTSTILPNIDQKALLL